MWERRACEALTYLDFLALFFCSRLCRVPAFVLNILRMRGCLVRSFGLALIIRRISAEVCI